MIKKILILLSIFSINLQAQAFEDYIITTDGKLTQIKIENNQIIDVFPLITVMNEKNTLIVHPLKEGSTCFSIKKNSTEGFLFHVKVTKDETFIAPVDGFDILPIDEPPIFLDYMLDEPPVLKPVQKNIKIDGANININSIKEEEN